MSSSKQVEVKLVGGLGNQLFIWATAYAIQKRSGHRVCLDASECTMWGYQLATFGISAQVEGPEKPDGKIPSRFLSSQSVALNFARRIREKWRRLNLGKTYWEDPLKSFDAGVFEIKPGQTLRGYFQSYKYFEGYSKEIREFLLSDRTYSHEFSRLKKILPPEWTAINLRLGADYKKMESTFGLVSKKYLVNSLTFIGPTKANHSIVVFTDNVNEAKIFFPEATLYIGKDDIPSDSERMILMSQATNLIGSNSSYSWWAAFLMEQEIGMRIFPKPWFKNLRINTEYLLPPSWIQIDNN